MVDIAFTTDAGTVIPRKWYVLYLNTGTSSAPVWSPVGKRVEDSSAEYDWGEESKTDIFGKTYTTFKDPVMTQSFDPCELDAGDVAQVKIWNQSIKDHDTSAMANNDMLLVHLYAAENFAERYSSCAVKPSSIGGSATVDMPIDVTFGGDRTVGKATINASGVVTFTEDA